MKYREIPSPMGGMMWQGDDLAGKDAGFALAESFLKKYPHNGWTLSISDALTQETAEIICDLSEMPKIISFVYNLEHAAPMLFIEENPMTESYVVGMTCTRGRIEIPGVYKAKDGKLISVV